jgi:lysophospholipase L1-like esterase
VIRSFAVVTTLALAACGSNSSDAPAPVPAQPVAQSAIAFYGDSTIYGYTWNGSAYVQADPTAPQTAGALLGATVDNRGIGGSDTACWLNASQGAPVTWAQEMSQQPAHIVVLQWGINDALRAIPVAQFTANLAAMITQAQNAGHLVVLETANPIAQTDLAPYAAAVIALASTWNVHVIDEFGLLAANPGWPAMLSDGKHPTQAGYDLKGHIEAAALVGVK